MKPIRPRTLIRHALRQLGQVTCTMHVRKGSRDTVVVLNENGEGGHIIDPKVIDMLGDIPMTHRKAFRTLLRKNKVVP